MGNIQDKLEYKLVKAYLKSPGIDSEKKVRTLASLLKADLESICFKKLNINYIGAALKAIGIKGKPLRIDRVAYSHGYEVEFLDERIARFNFKKIDGLVIEGIDIRDYDNPDDFNEAVKKAKEL